MDPLEGYGIEQAKRKGELRRLQPAIDQAALKHRCEHSPKRTNWIWTTCWVEPYRPDQKRILAVILFAKCARLLPRYQMYLWLMIYGLLFAFLSNLSSLYSSLARRATLLIYTSDEHESHSASGFFGWDIWFESDW